MMVLIPQELIDDAIAFDVLMTARRNAMEQAIGREIERQFTERDIVDRLNDACDETALCREAAGEIEALRQRVDDLKWAIDDYRR